MPSGSSVSKPAALRRVVVVGAGAVGGAIGGLIAEAGVAVALVARGDHGAAIREHGLALRLPERAAKIAMPCVEEIEDFAFEAGDVAVVATKLYDAEDALQRLRAHAPADLVVCLAVNGVAGEQWATDRFTNVLSTMVWLPATFLEPGIVRVHSGRARGVLDTGPLRGAPIGLAKSMCALLRRGGFDATPRSDIMRWKYAKLVANLGGTAQALVVDDAVSVIPALRAEGERVLEAAGVDRISTAELHARVSAVESLPVDGVPRQGGSTWQSQARGRPLETPWLEGEVLRIAQRLGVPAPICERLTAAAAASRTLTAAEALGRG